MSKRPNKQKNYGSFLLRFKKRISDQISRFVEVRGKPEASLRSEFVKTPADPEYIDDLIARMNSDEELPQTGVYRSSADTVAFQAYREAERLNDVSVLSQIKARVIAVKKLKSRDSSNLATVLSELIRNTGEPAGIDLYLELIKRSPKTGPPTMYLIDGAARAKIRECRAFVIAQLNTKSSTVLSSGIQYFGAIGDKNDVPIVGELLDADCNDVTNPMYCAIALQDIGSKAAFPYLKRAILRHKKSRKREGIDAHYYSAMAIKSLSGKGDATPW